MSARNLEARLAKVEAQRKATAESGSSFRAWLQSLPAASTEAEFECLQRERERLQRMREVPELRERMERASTITDWIDLFAAAEKYFAKQAAEAAASVVSAPLPVPGEMGPSSDDRPLAQPVVDSPRAVPEQDQSRRPGAFRRANWR